MKSLCEMFHPSHSEQRQRGTIDWTAKKPWCTSLACIPISGKRLNEFILSLLCRFLQVVYLPGFSTIDKLSCRYVDSYYIRRICSRRLRVPKLYSWLSEFKAFLFIYTGGRRPHHWVSDTVDMVACLSRVRVMWRESNGKVGKHPRSRPVKPTYEAKGHSFMSSILVHFLPLRSLSCIVWAGSLRGTCVRCTVWVGLVECLWRKYAWLYL